MNDTIIAGMNDMNGGICDGGIAHAGPVRYQPAMWFDGSTYVKIDNVSGILSETAILLTATIYDDRLSILSSEFARVFDARRSGSSGWVLGRVNLTGDQMRSQYSGVGTNFIAINSWGSYTKQVVSLATSITPDTDEHRIYLDGVKIASRNGGAITYLGGSAYIGFGAVAGCIPWKGVIMDVRLFDATGLSVAQIDAIAADPTSATPAAYWAGHGTTNADWRDQGSEGVHHGTVIGSPTPARIINGAKIYAEGEIKNP